MLPEDIDEFFLNEIGSIQLPYSHYIRKNIILDDSYKKIKLPDVVLSIRDRMLSTNAWYYFETIN